MAETYQAEALDPSDLAAIVRDRLSELIPSDVLDAAEDESEREREREELLSAIESVGE